MAKATAAERLVRKVIDGLRAGTGAKAGVRGDADAIKKEVDSLFFRNRIYERSIGAALIVLFGVAMWLTVRAHLQDALWLSTGVVIPGLGVSACWSIKKLLDIRRDNIRLVILPLVIPLLPPPDAATLLTEIMGL